MHLEINDATIAAPTRADVVASVPAKAPSADWSIALVRAEAQSLAADGRADGRFDISYVSGRSVYDATRPIDGHELRDMLLLYVSGDETWRSRLQWQPYKGADSPAPGWWLPSTRAEWRALAPHVALGLLALVLIAGPTAWSLLGLPRPRIDDFPMPAAFDSIPARLILGFFVLCLLVFVVAVIVKGWEVRKAAHWSSASGRIVRSEPGFKLVARERGTMPSNMRVANITYEFKVGARTYRGTRFTLAERVPEEEVAAILERYPVNAAVEVFYDPADPQSCVLDRSPPADIAKGCLTLLAVGIAGVVTLMWLVTNGGKLLSGTLPDAFLPIVAITGIASVFLLTMFVGLQRKMAATRNWPRTEGRIVSNRIHTFVSGRTRSQTPFTVTHGTRQAHMPVIEYAYTVAGKPYRSRSVYHATEVAGSRAYAEGIAARYPVGKVVEVRYDPADPSQAGLEFGARWSYILLVLGLLLMAVALNAAGVLGSSIFVARP